MTRLRTAVVGFAISVLAGTIGACDSDEADLLDLSGNWRLEALIGANTCGTPSGTLARGVSISQSGERVTFRIQEPDGATTTLTGRLSGDRIDLDTSTSPSASCPGGQQSVSGGGSASSTVITLDLTLTITCGAGSCGAHLETILTRV